MVKTESWRCIYDIRYMQYTLVIKVRLKTETKLFKLFENGRHFTLTLNFKLNQIYKLNF